jgi:hypothetical protein
LEGLTRTDLDSSDAPSTSEAGGRFRELIGQGCVFVQTYGLLAALIVFGLLVLLLSLRTAIPILTIDDITRTTHAYLWSRQPFLFTHNLVWLPLPMAITGIIIRLTGEIFYSGVIVNVIAMAIAIVYVYRLASLLFGRMAAWAAATLFALAPWVLFISLSRQSEPVMLAGTLIGIYYWVRWSRTGAPSDLSRAGLGLLAAAMSRYEVWPIGAGLAIYAVASLIHIPRLPRLSPHRPRFSIVWAFLPLAWIVLWIVMNLRRFGVPIYGGYGETVYTISASAIPTAARDAAAYMWELSPVLLVLAFVSLARGSWRAWLVGLLAVGEFLFMVRVFSQGTDRSFFPARFLLPILALLAVFAGAAVRDLVERSPAALLAVAVVMAALFVQGVRVNYPNVAPAVTALGVRLNQVGEIADTNVIFVQNTEEANLGFFEHQIAVATNYKRPVYLMHPDIVTSFFVPGFHDEVLIIGNGPPPAKGAKLIGKVDDISAWRVVPAR